MMKNIAQRLERSRLQISRRNPLGFQQTVKPEKLQVDDQGLLGQDGFLFGRSELAISLPDGQSTVVKTPRDIRAALDYAEQPQENLEALSTLDSEGYTFDAPDKRWNSVDDDWTSLDAFVHHRGLWCIQSPDGVLTYDAVPSVARALSSRHGGQLPFADRLDQVEDFEAKTGLSVGFHGRDYDGLSLREQRAVAISEGENFSFTFGKDNWGDFEPHEDLKEAWSQTVERAERLRKFDHKNQAHDPTVEYMTRRGKTYGGSSGEQMRGFDQLATRLEQQQHSDFDMPIRNILENIAQKGFAYQVAESNLDSFDEAGEVKADSIVDRETLQEMSAYWKLSEALSIML